MNHNMYINPNLGININLPYNQYGWNITIG